MDRRNFIKHSLMAAGSMMAAQTLGTALSLTSNNSATKKDTNMDYVTLNNGVQMSLLGYGTLRLTPKQCAGCVAKAIQKGWRLIDTAKNYTNETLIGKGIRRSGIDRLGTDYLDLYLLHQPFGDVYSAWRTLEDLYEEGCIRAIGASNFFPDRVTDFIFVNKVRPAVNQIEFSPYFQRWEDKQTNDTYGIQIEPWGPFCSGTRPELLQEPALVTIGGGDITRPQHKSFCAGSPNKV